MPKIQVNKIQVNKAFVFSEGARNCKDFSVTDLTAHGKAWTPALQTTISAQPICENNIVNITIIKLGRALIASKDLCQSTCSSTPKFTKVQFDVKVWSGIGVKHTAVIIIHF